jgi:hypothetical protein
MFIELLNKLSDSGRETPEKTEESPYIEPREPEIIPTEIPTQNPPQKQDNPIPETPPIKPQ